MLQKISSFDFFGNPFILNSKKRSKTYTTVIGGLLSIFTFVIISIITYIVVSDYRDTKKPVVSVNKVRLKAPLSINLFDHEVFSMFGAVHREFLSFEKSKKYLTIWVEIVTTTQDAQGNFVDKIELFDHNIIENLKSEGMKKLATNGLKNIAGNFDYFNLFKNNAVFPDLTQKDFYIKGSRDNLPYRRRRYKLYPCSLPNPADCASFNDLAEFQLGNTGLYKVANYSKKKDPLGYAGDSEDVFPLTISESVIITSYLKENFIYDKDLDLVGERRLSNTFVDIDRIKSVSKSRLSGSIHCSKAQINAGTCEPYMEMIWRSSYDKMVIERKYVTPFEAFSEIGGFFDLIFFGITAIYFYSNTRSYAQFIKSKLTDGYLELDQKRLGKDEKRSEDQIRRMRSKLMELKLEKEEPVIDKLPFKELLNTKSELKDLVELSFKAEIILQALIKNKKIFSALTLKLIYLKNTSKTNTSEKSIVEDRPQHGEQYAKEISKKRQILSQRNRLDGGGGTPKIKRAKKRLEKDSQKELTEQSKGIEFEDHRAFETIDEDLQQKHLKEKPKSLFKINRGLNQPLGEQNKLKISFSRRSVSKPGDKKKIDNKRFAKVDLRGRSPGPSNFAKQFGPKN